MSKYLFNLLCLSSLFCLYLFVCDLNASPPRPRHASPPPPMSHPNNPVGQWEFGGSVKIEKSDTGSNAPGTQPSRTDKSGEEKKRQKARESFTFGADTVPQIKLEPGRLPNPVPPPPFMFSHLSFDSGGDETRLLVLDSSGWVFLRNVDRPDITDDPVGRYSRNPDDTVTITPDVGMVQSILNRQDEIPIRITKAEPFSAKLRNIGLAECMIEFETVDTKTPFRARLSGVGEQNNSAYLKVFVRNNGAPCAWPTGWIEINGVLASSWVSTDQPFFDELDPGTYNVCHKWRNPTGCTIQQSCATVTLSIANYRELTLD